MNGLSRLQGLIGMGMVAIVAALCIWLTIERANHATTRAALSAEKSAHVGTVAGYRMARALAAAADLANAVRVADEQRELTERTEHDYQDRIAAVRSDYDRRLRALAARADSSRSGGTPVPDLPDTTQGPDGAAGDRRLPGADPDELTSLEWRRIATEQAIQLDALIGWVAAQAAIDFGNPVEGEAQPRAGGE